MTTRELIHQVKTGSAVLAASDGRARDGLLSAIREGLLRDWPAIKEANDRDVEAAKDLAPSVRARLTFSRDKLDASVKGIGEVANLPDPIGKVLEKRELDSGFVLRRVSVPLGVVGMIFEARPDALIQIVSLAAKSGNGIILKGGSEAANTNSALASSISRSSDTTEIGDGWLLLLHSREDVNVMLSCREDLDLVIPRGSNQFVRYVMDHTSIPVLGHASGICHMYVDKDARLEMGVSCSVDAKTNYPAACNAIETLLVHVSIAAVFVPMVAAAFRKAGVVIHGDETVCSLVQGCVPYADGDWEKEYLALEINIHVVKDEDEAISFINAHGSHHTDAIITENPAAAEKFRVYVDSADVFVNCSTRFADGYRFGLGAEVGISTSKIHARGPVGLSGLMTSKWLLTGHGEVVSTYMGKDARPFTHKELS
ncbi:MAG: glutamate-5-semialdehyde dehydrogenase [Sphaerochaetaceae bacterium]